MDLVSVSSLPVEELEDRTEADNYSEDYSSGGGETILLEFRLLMQFDGDESSSWIEISVLPFFTFGFSTFLCLIYD